jgi:hypothetical protein
LLASTSTDDDDDDDDDDEDDASLTALDIDIDAPSVVPSDSNFDSGRPIFVSASFFIMCGSDFGSASSSCTSFTGVIAACASEGAAVGAAVGSGDKIGDGNLLGETFNVGTGVGLAVG